MKEIIIGFIDDKKEVAKNIKIFVKNKSNNIDDRWDLFIEAGEAGILPTKKYIEHFNGELEEWLQDDVLDGERVSKYQTFTADSCFDKAINDDKSIEFRDDLREQWMDKFIYSFNFDW